jgi:cysteine desulfurase/selenocysteine lyase
MPLAPRTDFPLLSSSTVRGHQLAYLDSAATSQKPQVVLDAINDYYSTSNANVHRGAHFLGDKSTQAWHQARQTIAQFLGATPQELVITRNTTEALNLAARAVASSIQPGDRIITTLLEHHSNFVPWQRLARERQAELVVVKVDKQGQLDWDQLNEVLASSTPVRVVALSHISNTLGSVFPLSQVVEAVRHHHKNAVIVVDGAQAAVHMDVKFDQLGVDAYALSAHKMLGPMGIGALLVRRSLLETWEPVLVGGGMIDEVTLEKTTYATNLEERFTAGTPDVASLVGWAAACEYLDQWSWSQHLAHDRELVDRTLEIAKKFPELEIIGPTDPDLPRIGSVAFVHPKIHAHDIGQVLDSVGVAVRSGHHCTMPLHNEFGWPASVRASFQCYTDLSELDALAEGLRKVAAVFGNL